MNHDATNATRATGIKLIMHHQMRDSVLPRTLYATIARVADSTPDMAMHTNATNESTAELS